MIRVAINGFGRIGRNALRAAWGQSGVKIVAINDLADTHTLAHLLKYDSVHGTWSESVRAKRSSIVIGKQDVPVFSERDPKQLPWKELKVDVVIESTGFFTKEADARMHYEAGAKYVLISAPSKDAPTLLNGVNHDKAPNKPVVCMASCTTNSVGAVMSVFKSAFGIQKAMLTTIHAATATQNIVDGLPPKGKNDLRRARGVFNNIIPTTTGAAKATSKAIPQLKDKFDGVAVRVPISDMSLSDITILSRKNVTVEQVNEVFKKAARLKHWKGILAVSDKPLVSTDYIGDPHAGTVDLGMTRVVDGNLVKLMVWYDNEWGYASQLARMLKNLAKRV